MPADVSRRTTKLLKRGNGRRGTTCRALFLRSWQLAAFAPEVDCEDDGDEWEDAAEFVDEPCGLPRVARERRENALDIEIVAAVEDGGCPEAAGFETHPGKKETQGNNHHGETHQAVPRGRPGVVIAVDQNGIVP